MPPAPKPMKNGKATPMSAPIVLPG